MILLSEYLSLNEELDDLGVFDTTLDCDRPFFINLLRLREAKTPEFINSYEKIYNFFDGIILLLDESTNTNDDYYKVALRQFRFSEVNETNLGFADGKSGQGFGKQLREQVISHAFNIVKAGCKNPRFFELMELFESNIGPDRISDMITTIIVEDIQSYTLRIWKELGINENKYPDCRFDKEFLLNPYKNGKKIYLLPIEILKELPIAKSWDEIDDVMDQNQAIRNEINGLVSKVWKKYTASEKKECIRTQIFENPGRSERVLKSYENEKTSPLDLKSASTFNIDPYYYAKKVAKYLKEDRFSFDLKHHETSRDVAIEMLDYFGAFVYDHKGWSLIQAFSTNNGEKFTQRLIDACCRSIVTFHGFDISFEADEGVGPVDIKVSKGLDKTIIEVKLSTNIQYLHGFSDQVQQYGKSENTSSMIYLFIDKGNPGRMRKVKDSYQELKYDGMPCPDVYLVDARKRDSASIGDFSMSKHYGLYDPDSIFPVEW